MILTTSSEGEAIVVNRKQGLIGAAVAISAAALTLGAGVSGAGAEPTPPALAGYIIVSSPADVTVAPGTQTHAEVSCPVGTAPVSGGAKIPDFILTTNMNSSHPTGKRSWAVDMNNSGASADSMRLYAVCVKRPATKYTVTTATFDSPANSQSVGSVTCPSGVVLGGGVRSSSTNTAVNIDTSYPSSTSSWNVWMNNASASATTFDVVAICKNAKPAGYLRQEGAAVPNPAGEGTFARVICKGTRIPTGGGVYSDGSGLHQNLSTSAPAENWWYNFYNNADATANTIHPWTICVGS
jgi:hypothetical protein